MNETISLPAQSDMENDLAYLTKKRDDALEHFNEKLKSHLLTDEELHKRLDTVLRFNNQVKLLQDAIVVYNVTQAKNK